MKREIINFVAVIGLVLLGAAVVLGLLTGVLFLFPNTTIMGAKSVNERDTQIVYRDADLVKAFENGKFILESSGTKIEVKMSNEGYDGQNTVVVNESATGIAFNSLSRTLIEWTQTRYGTDDELYYRIKILEPSGMVFNSKPTTVYINLPYREDDFRYDFVLQNSYSDVNFSFVDDSVGSEGILIDDLVVEGAASVNLIYNENSSVNKVVVKGNNTKLTCKSKVLNDVVVTGSKNNLDFGNGDSAGIAGNITINGANNQFKGTSANKVNYRSETGSLNMSGSIASLDVETVSASISVNNVVGATTMTTRYGSLNANSIGNGLTFTAGTVTAAYGTAAVDVGRLTGEATVNNYGIGAISLNNVNGNVTINSTQIGGGAINVSFAENASNNTIQIMGYDGNINVSGINGGNVKITILGERLRAGAAKIYAHFNQVGTAEIRSGGYISGPLDWGNVEVRLADSCNNLNLYVYYARSANSSAKYGFENENMLISSDEEAKVNHITVNSDNEATEGTLLVYAQTTFYLS